MKKMNNKGIFLIETLIVTTISIAVLTLFYRQIATFYQRYEDNYYYDRVQGVHAANNIKTLIFQEGIEGLIEELDDNLIIDITDYEFNQNVSRQDFYQFLKDYSNIDKIYFTPFNINELINNINPYNFDYLFINYLKTLATISIEEENVYRLILVFNNDTFASVLIEDSGL